MKTVSSIITGKSPTGITGFDEITGGLPRGRTTLLLGGPGSGKTIFALQFLLHGARDYKEPGIFVAFEETSQRLIANAEGFGWKLAVLHKKLYFMDAQHTPDLVQSGSFDLSGMLAMLDVKIKEIGAQRIVFDAIDIVLALLPDPADKRREIYRLHEWLLARELTGLITDDAWRRILSRRQCIDHGLSRHFSRSTTVTRHKGTISAGRYPHRNLRACLKPVFAREAH